MPRLDRARRRTASVIAGLATLATAGGLAACSSSKNTAGGAAGAGKSTDRRAATITVTAANGCVSDRTDFAAGAITFTVVNKDATAVSEVEVLDGGRIIGEKENLPPGFSGTFAVTAKAGKYTLYCPGAASERATLTVTGSAGGAGDSSVAALLQSGTGKYAAYVRTQVGYLLATVKTLDTALHGGDLAAAQKAYIAARPFYEKIEPVAESFTIGTDSVDADIDARENDVPAAQWKGFHRIEKGLFATERLAGLGSLGDELVVNVQKLQRLTAALTYQPTELANGAQELLDEVAATKITGEEERYSRIDLLDIAYNTEGAQQAFGQLQPALAKIDGVLAADIVAKFAALSTLVDSYRDVADASGFVRYTALTSADKRRLAAAVKAVQEPLSRVASKLANS